MNCTFFENIGFPFQTQKDNLLRYNCNSKKNESNPLPLLSTLIHNKKIGDLVYKWLIETIQILTKASCHPYSANHTAGLLYLC